MDELWKVFPIAFVDVGRSELLELLTVRLFEPPDIADLGHRGSSDGRADCERLVGRLSGTTQLLYRIAPANSGCAWVT